MIGHLWCFCVIGVIMYGIFRGFANKLCCFVLNFCSIILFINNLGFCETLTENRFYRGQLADMLIFIYKMYA